MIYFESVDVLHLSFSDDEEAGSVELSHNITAELNEAGELIGVEILHAKEFLITTVLESVQAKIILEKKAA